MLARQSSSICDWSIRDGEMVASSASDDVLALEQRVIDAVRDRFGVTLSPEVEHLG